MRSFRGGGGKWQISTDGATDPVWRRDGRALLYREAGHLVEATLDTKSGVVVTARRTIADDRFVADNGVNIDAAPNGSILALQPTESVTELNVVLGWLAEVDRRLAPRR